MTALAHIPPGAKIIRPQPGFQEKFVGCEADIVWGGAAAGVGKTFAVLLDYLRFHNVTDYGAVVFRRTTKQVKGEGGLWDTAEKLFSELPPKMQPTPNFSEHSWTFRNKNKFSFAHLQYEKDKLNWQGTQISYLAFDELTQFSESQYWYLIGRMRSTSGFRALCRCTMNPEESGWVKDFLLAGGYLYPDDYHDEHLASFPIKEMDGVIRFYLKDNGVILWGDTHTEVALQVPPERRHLYTSDDILSFTFIAGNLEDNVELMKNNPGYRGKLLSGDEDKVMQLYYGRWTGKGGDRHKLFQTVHLNDLFTNDFVESGENYMTCDIAMEGVDLFTIAVWDGWRLEHAYSYPRTLGDEVLKRIKEVARRHAVPGRNIAFDSAGVGNYLKGFMRNSVAVLGNASPYPVEGQAQRYDNLRAQLHYHARDKVEENEAYVAVDRKSEAGRHLFEEMNAISKTETRKGLAVESKASLKPKIKGRSPDWLDVFVMRSIFDLMPRAKKRIGAYAG